MKIKLDENVPSSLCEVFSKHGGKADTVFSEGLQGCSDDLLFRRVRDEDRLLITSDLDFADTRHFPPSESGGIVVLRLANRSSKSVAGRIEKMLEQVPLSDLCGAITIVSDDRIRMRR